MLITMNIKIAMFKVSYNFNKPMPDATDTNQEPRTYFYEERGL